MKRTVTIVWSDADEDALRAYMRRLGLKHPSYALARLARIGLHRSEALTTYNTSPKGRRNRRRDRRGRR
jgi:hypothetical protein